nr:EOG090X0DEG [Ceriodaphnia reticulata]
MDDACALWSRRWQTPPLKLRHVSCTKSQLAFWFSLTISAHRLGPGLSVVVLSSNLCDGRRSATGMMVSLLLLGSVVTLATAFRSHQETVLSDAYLRGIMNHLGDKILADATGSEGYLDYPLPSYEDMMSPSVTSEAESEMKEYEEAPESLNEPRERLGLGLSLRDQEPKLITCLLSSSGSSGNTENVLPAYCNPPNPCPIGYTAEDGCLEEFENTAAFSREYQAAQDCMCDTEHMFDCPASSLNNKNSANSKNRAAANMVDKAIRKIMSDFQGEHKSLVSKKFFNTKSENPYLQGDKLPIAAKKGNRVVA